MSSNAIPVVAEVAERVRSLRIDMEISPEEMAQATDMSVDEYLLHESGSEDFTFTFLHKCAKKLGVDLTEILTGDSPKLKGYSLVRAGEGLDVKRRVGFEYLHKAPYFDGKLCEPFVVRAPYCEEEQNAPIPVNKHSGQELDFILEGKLKFTYGGHVEILEPGDCVLYDSGNEHGTIAIDGEDCLFLAIVIPQRDVCTGLEKGCCTTDACNK